MRVVIADDDRMARLILQRTLERWKYDVSAAADGEEAWALIERLHPPLVILDWMMPVLDGAALCRRIRASAAHAGTFVMLLTARDTMSDLVSGFEAGADDYLVKPFQPEELQARIAVAERILSLQTSLAARVTELEAALAHVRQLHGMLPICSYCKRIRTDENSWDQMEKYISEHSEAEFSHGICPTCYEKVKAEFGL